MLVKRLILGLAVIGVLALALGQPAPTLAQSAPIFNLSAASAYLRDVPSPQAERTYSIFQGVNYPVTGRTADSAWLQVAFAAAARGTWVPANYGTVIGPLSAVPVVAAVVSEAVVGNSAGPAATPLVVPLQSAAVGPVRGKLTITAASTYVRAAPDWGSTRTASLFKNAVVNVTGRDVAGNWLQIVYGGPGWVPAGVGAYSGDVMSLPIGGGAPPPPTAVAVEAAAAPAELPAWIPILTPRMRNLYALAGQRGRNLRAFAVAGDCNSESYLYTDLIGKGWYGYENNEYLHPTWLYFGRSMNRPMLAVDGGFNTASVMDPIWANPEYCLPGESPFACELRVPNASVVFILLGTGDQFQWQSFETNYRKLLDHALAQNVLPVLVTKADSLEEEEGGATPGYINNVIRRLAGEYELPLFDFHQAIQDLPNRGLIDEPGHDFHLNAEAIGVHVLGTMQTLYSIRNR